MENGIVVLFLFQTSIPKGTLNHNALLCLWGKQDCTGRVEKATWRDTADDSLQRPGSRANLHVKHEKRKRKCCLTLKTPSVSFCGV